MDRPSSPLSPGETLRMALADEAITPNQLAVSMKVTSSCVWYLLHDQRRITRNLAPRLASVLKGKPEKPPLTAEEWLAVQNRWDLRPIEQEAGA